MQSILDMLAASIPLAPCLIPASGFYEWSVVPGQKAKPPFDILFINGTPMSFAGIWETCRMSAGKFDICAIIPTTRANAVLAPIYSRIPLFQTAMPGLQLNPEPVAMGKLKTLISPCDTEGTQPWHVSTDVCRVVNDGLQ